MISIPTIRRLPLYLSFLKSIRNNELKQISARAIAIQLQIDPSQITKDFSYIHITGKTKIGYNIETLISRLEDFLGYHRTRKTILVGIGNLGLAILKYIEFSEEGMDIIAGFDVDTKKIGKKIRGVSIFNMVQLEQIYTKTPADIGIITVPFDQAQIVADEMIKCGVKAIWNFSSRPISAPKNIIIENTSIDSGLAMIKWKLNKNKPLIYKNRVL